MFDDDVARRMPSERHVSSRRVFAFASVQSRPRRQRAALDAIEIKLARGRPAPRGRVVRLPERRRGRAIARVRARTTLNARARFAPNRAASDGANDRASACPARARAKTFQIRIRAVTRARAPAMPVARKLFDQSDASAPARALERAGSSATPIADGEKSVQFKKMTLNGDESGDDAEGTRRVSFDASSEILSPIAKRAGVEAAEAEETTPASPPLRPAGAGTSETSFRFDDAASDESKENAGASDDDAMSFESADASMAVNMTRDSENMTFQSAGYRSALLDFSSDDEFSASSKRRKFRIGALLRPMLAFAAGFAVVAVIAIEVASSSGAKEGDAKRGARRKQTFRELFTASKSSQSSKDAAAV